MKQCRDTVVGLFLLANVAAGLLGEAVHNKPLALRLSPDPVVAPHGCGDQEHHVPLDGLHPCMLCTGLSHRAFLAVAPLVVPAPSSILLGTLAAAGDDTRSADRPRCHTRAPPA